MLIEGLKLLIIGMATVIIFLGMMVYCIQGIAWRLRAWTAKEEQQWIASQQDKTSPTPALEAIPIAVFAAAIAAFEADRQTVRVR